MQQFLDRDEAEIYRPLFSHLLARQKAKPLPPFIPELQIMPLHQFAKLCLMLKDAGFSRIADSLAQKVLKRKAFPSFWCREKEYHKTFFDQMMRVLEETFSGKEIEKDGWDFQTEIIQTEGFSLALSFDGYQTSLGALSSVVKIQAFGPQSDPLHFGIEGRGKNGWVQSSAYPEVWLEMLYEVKKEAVELHFRVCGLCQKKPLSLAFYIQAKECSIEQTVLYPKNLNRFAGQTSEVEFEKKLKIQTEKAHRVEVISLAGEGCFWDSDFLLLYPFSPFSSQLSLKIIGFPS